MKPCADCPFRKEPYFHLSEGRREEIADALRAGGRFPCHKTVDYDARENGGFDSKSVFCAGAMAVMDNDPDLAEHGGCLSNQMVRIEARFSPKCDPDNVQGRELVYDSLGDFVADQREVSR